MGNGFTMLAYSLASREPDRILPLQDSCCRVYSYTLPNSQGPTFMEPIILVSQSKFLLVLHALLAMLLIGSMTHNVLITTRYLWGRFHKVKLEKLYVKVAFTAYLLTFSLGSLLYPNYRYHVRAQYLDKQAPWATNLFDIKEHWAAIGLALFGVYLILSLTMDPQKDRPVLFLYVFLSVILAVIVWFAVIAGLLVTSVKGV